MKQNNKKKLLLVVMMVFVIALVSLGTYALFNIELVTGNNAISTGQIKMSYTEVNEIEMTNALPMKDDEGKVLNNYFDFQVLTYIKTRANDDTKRKINYNIVLDPLDTDNPLNDNEIKVYLTKISNGVETVVVEPTTIYNLNKYVLNSHEEIFSNNKGEVIDSYRLRAWIDDSVDTSRLSDNSYSYRFRVNINNEAPPKEDYALAFAKANVGTNGLELVTHDIDNTLQVDKRFVTEYRYRGGDSVVNNYVTFNNEVWRIIGVIPTEDTSGNVENRIKIIKEDALESMNWNGGYTNNWTVAELNNYLNNNYYNTLNDEAKNMIGTTKYYLGGYSSQDINTESVWQYERKNETNRSGYYYGTNPIMQSDVSKKIAIMYASDYGYAALKECSRNLYYFNVDSNCVNKNNWLGKSRYEWLLTPASNDSGYAFHLYSDGSIGSSGVGSSKYNTRPVLTLSSNIKISGGAGTSSSPYQLSIQ